MAYWNTGDEDSDDSRFRAAGLSGCGMYVMAGSWCMGQVRGRFEEALPVEWFVPDHWVRGWDGGTRTATKLVKCGLWKRVEGGYLFAVIRPNNTPDAVREVRKGARDRKRRQRSELP